MFYYLLDYIILFILKNKIIIFNFFKFEVELCILNWSLSLRFIIHKIKLTLNSIKSNIDSTRLHLYSCAKVSCFLFLWEKKKSFTSLSFYFKKIFYIFET